MKSARIAALVLCAVSTVPISACIIDEDEIIYAANVDMIDDGVVIDLDFQTGPQTGLDFIAAELAHTWAGDLQITLTSPEGTQYVAMSDELDPTGSGSFDLGVTPGDASLANVDLYKWMPGGVSYDVDFAPTGIYEPNAWASGPHAAGTWNLRIVDTVGGDPTSVGRVCVNFQAVPEPATMTWLGSVLGLMLFGGRGMLT